MRSRRSGPSPPARTRHRCHACLRPARAPAAQPHLLDIGMATEGFSYQCWCLTGRALRNSAAYLPTCHTCRVWDWSAVEEEEVRQSLHQCRQCRTHLLPPRRPPQYRLGRRQQSRLPHREQPTSGEMKTYFVNFNISILKANLRFWFWNKAAIHSFLFLHHRRKS